MGAVYMPRALVAENGATYIVGSTDTVKLAKRVIETGRVIAGSLPKGFVAPSVMELLLALYLAEEDARYLTISELSMNEGLAISVATRWISALCEIDLVEKRNGLIALTGSGYSTVITTLQDIFKAQRMLD